MSTTCSRYISSKPPRIISVKRVARVGASVTGKSEVWSEGVKVGRENTIQRCPQSFCFLIDSISCLGQEVNTIVTIYNLV